MHQGDIQARHYTTGEPVFVRWREGRLTELAPCAQLTDPDLWIAPALVDLQVNGFAGVDFQQDGLSEADLRRAVRALRDAGCGGFLYTLITDEWSTLIARLKHVRALRTRHADLRRAILGWHVEGPFLSPEPGFRGAHDPAVMIDPRPEHVRELRAAAGDDVVLLTLAPERAGALEAIRLAVSLGMTVSLGHTNASALRLREASTAGARGFTHLGNACPQLLDRHDNILWRVLDTPGLTVSLIPDRIHVSPPLFRLVHRALPAEAIYYVTDAMAAAGAPPGRYSIGKLVLEVGDDQVVRLPGQRHFAGSALRPIDGVWRAAEMLGCRWQEVWDRFSVGPARLVGREHGLAVGRPACFCLLRAPAKGPPHLVRTMAGAADPGD